MTQKINLSDFEIKSHNLVVKREDLIHPFVSGNKFRKLKYNILTAREQKHDTI
ncbi:MAG: 1-aminocyclopropane-1-carboxylate deaminase/D-cysteine desulfhydrase, partial [Aequorivita sp.]|nr:1-aminocyclopropane-1-carboxylate deaminase/D-cysteine desulfhydrase [Aequorivita sp.]